jgi:hypothetical protein
VKAGLLSRVLLLTAQLVLLTDHILLLLLLLLKLWLSMAWGGV